MIPWQTNFGNDMSAYSKEAPLPGTESNGMFQNYINKQKPANTFMSDLAAKISGNPTTSEVQQINQTSVQPTAWRPPGSQEWLPVAQRPEQSQGFISPENKMFQQNMQTSGQSGGGGM